MEHSAQKLLFTYGGCYSIKADIIWYKFLIGTQTLNMVAYDLRHVATWYRCLGHSNEWLNEWYKIEEFSRSSVLVLNLLTLPNTDFPQYSDYSGGASRSGSQVSTHYTHTHTTYAHIIHTHTTYAHIIHTHTTYAHITHIRTHYTHTHHIRTRYTHIPHFTHITRTHKHQCTGHLSFNY